MFIVIITEKYIQYYLQIFFNKDGTLRSFKTLDISRQVNIVLAIIRSKYVIFVGIILNDLFRTKNLFKLYAKLNLQVRHWYVKRNLRK